MSLVDLIRAKSSSMDVATAISAIPATDGGGGAGTVATIATVAVANPGSEKTEGPSAARRWLIRTHDREDLDVTCCPAATLAEVLAAYPAGTIAEPLSEGELEGPPPSAQGVDPRPAPPSLVRCGGCAHFDRLEGHPHLGHCQAGEPGAPCGLWGTDRRVCEVFASAVVAPHDNKR